MKISGSENRRARRALASGAVIAVVLWSTSLAAQAVDDATRNAARELAAQAGEAYEKGDYTRAQDLYHRAYALLPAPTLSLREARALEKLGRLVEAVEAYVRTTRTALESSSPEPYRQAVQQASDELGKLRPRVPKLTIVIKGASGEVTVSLDGKPIKSALVGVAQPVNPGKHDVAAIGEQKSGNARLSIAEGESKTLTVELKNDPNATVTPAAEKTEVSASADPGVEAPSSGSTQKTLGWVGIGLGVAGVGVGVVTGLMATSKHSSADEGCPDGNCPAGSQAADDLESFRTLRTVSTIGYAVGIVGVVAGVTLLITAPSTPTTAFVSPYLGAGSAGVAGRF
jgi:hypothetical protein